MADVSVSNRADCVYFKFSIKEDVKIIALNLPAKVMARCDRGNDIRDYRLIFWSEGKRYDEWVFEHEIQEQKKPSEEGSQEGYEYSIAVNA